MVWKTVNVTLSTRPSSHLSWHIFTLHITNVNWSNWSFVVKLKDQNVGINFVSVFCFVFYFVFVFLVFSCCFFVLFFVLFLFFGPVHRGDDSNVLVRDWLELCKICSINSSPNVLYVTSFSKYGKSISATFWPICLPVSTMSTAQRRTEYWRLGDPVYSRIRCMVFFCKIHFISHDNIWYIVFVY